MTLEPELHRAARARSAELGISLAEYMRRLVRRDLDAPARRADVRAVFDLGSSGGADIRRDKDRLLGEAVDSAVPLRPGRRHAADSRPATAARRSAGGRRTSR